MSGTNLRYPVTMDVSAAMKSLDELDKKLSSLARTVQAQVNVTANAPQGQADQGAREAQQAQRDANAAERRARAEAAAEQREQDATLRQIHAQDAAEQREQAQAMRQLHAQAAAERREQAEVIRQIDASEAAAQKQAREALRGMERQELNERRILIEFEEQAVAEQLAAERAIQATIKEQNQLRRQAENELGRSAVERIRELKMALQEGLTEATFEARNIASGVRSGFSNANTTSRMNVSGATATAREDTAMTEAAANVATAKARADAAAAVADQAKLNAAQTDTLQNRIAAERALGASAVANSNLLAAEEQAATISRISEVSRAARSGASQASTEIMQQSQTVAQAELAAAQALAMQKQTATEAEKSMEATLAARAKANAATRIQAQADHAVAQDASAANVAAAENAAAASRRANADLQAAQARQNAAVQVAQQREADAAAAQGRFQQAAAEREGSVQRLEMIKMQAVQLAAALEQEGAARLGAIKASIEQIKAQTAIQIAQMRATPPALPGGGVPAGGAVRSAAAAEESVMSRAAGGMLSMPMGMFGVMGSMGAISGIEGVIKAGRAMEQLHNTMLAATGSEMNAAAQMNYVREYADKMGLSLTTAGEAYGKLLIPAREAGLTIQQTQKIFEGFTTATTALHLTDDKTQRVLFDITKMASEGTIQQRDVRNLSRLLPGGEQLFSNALGMTTHEFMAGTKKSQFDVSDIVKIAEYIKTHFQEAADSASGSMTGAFNRMSTALFTFKDEVAHGGFFQALTEELGQLSKSLNSEDGKAFAKTLGTVLADGTYALGHGIQFVIDHAKALEVVLGTLVAYKGFTLMSSGISTLALGLESAVATMLRFSNAAQGVVAASQTMAGAAGVLTSGGTSAAVSGTMTLQNLAAGKTAAMVKAEEEVAAAALKAQLAQRGLTVETSALIAAQQAAREEAILTQGAFMSLGTALKALASAAVPAGIVIGGIGAAINLYAKGIENIDNKQAYQQRAVSTAGAGLGGDFRSTMNTIGNAENRGQLDAALSTWEEQVKKRKEEAMVLEAQQKRIEKNLAEADKQNFLDKGTNWLSDQTTGRLLGNGQIEVDDKGTSMTKGEAQILLDQIKRSRENLDQQIADGTQRISALAAAKRDLLPEAPTQFQQQLNSALRKAESQNRVYSAVDSDEFMRRIMPTLDPNLDPKHRRAAGGVDLGHDGKAIAEALALNPILRDDPQVQKQLEEINRQVTTANDRAQNANVGRTTAQIAEDLAIAGDKFKQTVVQLARGVNEPTDGKGNVINEQRRPQLEQAAREKMQADEINHPKQPNKAERFMDEMDAEVANAQRLREAMQQGLPVYEHMIAVQQAEERVRRVGIDLMSEEGKRAVAQMTQKIELASATKKTVELLQQEMTLTAASAAAKKTLAAYSEGNPQAVYEAMKKAKEDEAAAKAGPSPVNQALARGNADMELQTASTQKLAEMTFSAQQATRAARVEMEAYGSNGAISMEKITTALQRQQQEQQLVAQYGSEAAQKMIGLLHEQWTAQDQLNAVKIAAAERDKMISSTVDNVATAFESMTKSGAKLKNVLHDLVGSMGKTAMSTFVTGPMKTLLSGGSFSDPHVSGGAMSLMGMLGIGGGYQPPATSAAVPGSATSQIGANGALTSAGTGLLGRLFGASGAAASVASANMTVATANITVTSALGSVGGGVGGSAGGWLSSLFGGSSSSGAAGAAGATGAGTDIMAARANGGEVDGGWAKPTLVGERGPELFWPKVSGSVMNNNDYANMVRSYSGGGGSSSGGGNTVHAPITIVAPNPQAFSESQGQVASRIQDMMRAGMRNR